jgi:2-polyprenyl-3-methyl-5-hydroxy-6-metoxy-1,4-benzoquinol methylase
LKIQFYCYTAVQRQSSVVHRTEFAVILPELLHLSAPKCQAAPDTDEEDIEGRESPKRIIIYHTLATRLLDVGCQVWAASLLIADWLIHAQKHGGKDMLRTVLELGAGVGLPSLAAAACGADVLLTDRNVPALELAQKSFEANSVWIRPRGGNIKVLTPLSVR